ncbi:MULTISPECIES: NAD(P)H-quinone oxidoreductase subunit N [Planktothricoides]|uniref:NAD(P)H-quinone oxidoreductase subunit N n=2 Tax=Planktothricoides raciborskii TaxID=132608 RepID=A0AAU8J8T9_9CYAN|nr:MULTISPECIES: NAD(P)H-quinone oxidoreductase subunit N [Planktothricoides]KOR34481.1 NAD(P)H-quinone oxidoreductase [Planktothricoides sp. SR001]MBD2546578.1 NAD(P)H-quinone oxidoreductase subunit N [Planktothricoides raciborskii FACHB-1370]MBD2584982.1 NAD(P)H-quinone oxidoreductase subunit N [Planktothricoides raciborskii FACHB-1261]
MALITTGKPLIRDLEKMGSVAVYAPLEGGFEGRYIRRLRAAGYTSLSLSARGLGDLSMYLTGVHGVRPPHLGKKDIRTYFIPPILNYHLEKLPPKSKGLVLWILEGYVLSSQEIEYLTVLPSLEPRVKLVVEMGGDRSFRWTPLKDMLIPTA